LAKCESSCILDVAGHWVNPSLPTLTIDLSPMGTLYCWYTLALLAAHHCSACFSLNRFRLQQREFKIQ
jgi:hypothetical protein